MNFRKTTEEWTDTDGKGYRVVHRKFGYYATVLVVGECGCRRPWHDFAWHRRPYRTHDAAVRACERHRRLWERFLKLGAARGNRRARLKELEAKGKAAGVNVLGSLPMWVKAKAIDDARLTALIRMQFGDTFNQGA